MKIRLLTRKSPLAMAQAHAVESALKSHFVGIEVVCVGVDSEGDKHLDQPVAQLGGKSGAFTHTLERALMAGVGDIAVHSLKDLPAILPDDFVLAGFVCQEDPRDCLVGASSFEALQEGAVIGTSSPRRLEQLKRFRSDLVVRPIRGNVLTRMKLLESGRYDGLVLACAGLNRLHLMQSVPHCHMNVYDFLPAFGQGIIALECRKDALETIKKVKRITDAMAHHLAVCQRSCLQMLGASCEDAVAGMSWVNGGDLCMRAEVYAQFSSKKVSSQFEALFSSKQESSCMLGQRVADALIDKGALDFLKRST